MTAIALLMLFAADTPLSAILIEGEGWKPGEGRGSLPRVAFSAHEKGGYLHIEGETPRRSNPNVAVPAEGEAFGPAALSPGGGLLVVGVPTHHYLYAFQVTPAGLTAKEKLYTLRREKPKGGSGVCGLAFDTMGRLFAAMPEGVQFFDEDARFSGQLSRPERKPVTAVWFGGGKKDELFIVCGGRTWKRKVKARGAE